MKNIWTIFVKELKRVFSDRRMLIALFLPGLLIFIIYSFMGDFMKDTVMTTKTKDTIFEIAYTDNYASDTSAKPRLLTYLDASLVAMGDGNTIHATAIKKDKIDEYKEKLMNKEIHLLVTYSDNFEDNLADSTKQLENSICLFYNGETTASSECYTFASASIKTAYVNYLENIIGTEYQNPNLGSKDSTFMQILSFIFPILTVSVLFSAVVTVCPEAIAGEKERGTLASMLLTPIKRSEFALGKILSLSVLSIASGLMSFLGIIFSFPKLMGLSSIPLNAVEILLLFLLIISALILFVAIGTAISAIANTVKEATAYLSPFMMVFMMLGILPAIIGTHFWTAFVPILNLSACMHALLMGSNQLLLIFTVTVGVNIFLAAIMMFFITKLFEKENVVLGN